MSEEEVFAINSSLISGNTSFSSFFFSLFPSPNDSCIEKRRESRPTILLDQSIVDSARKYSTPVENNLVLVEKVRSRASRRVASPPSGFKIYEMQISRAPGWFVRVMGANGSS